MILVTIRKADSNTLPCPTPIAVREILPSLPEAVDFHCNTAKAVKEGKTLVKR